MIESVVEEGDTILDIGAHIGTFSIPFSFFNKRKGAIYAFEADPDNYALLLKNIQANNLEDVISAENAVVSETTGSKYAACLPNNGNSGMYYFKPDVRHSKPKVRSINIDEWHSSLQDQRHINFIKIDVEGAERHVLKSCKRLLDQFRPALYIEINTPALRRFESTYQDLEDILLPLGYRFFRNIGPRNSGKNGFKMVALTSVLDGGGFFDLLAVHPSDVRFPKRYFDFSRTSV